MRGRVAARVGRAASTGGDPRRYVVLDAIGRGAMGVVYEASLLRRIYLDDVLACPCGGFRRVIADVTERDAIVAILHQLGLDPDAPPAVGR